MLFNRASDETERLEQTETIYDRIDSEEACKIAGGRPSSAGYKSDGSVDIKAITQSAVFDTCYPPA